MCVVVVEWGLDSAFRGGTCHGSMVGPIMQRDGDDLSQFLSCMMSTYLSKIQPYCSPPPPHTHQAANAAIIIIIIIR